MLKKITFLALASIAVMSSQAQTDTTKQPTPAGDTVRIGNIIILKNGGTEPTDNDRNVTININTNRKKSSSKVTNWGIVDIGFNNFIDNTNYASAEAQAFAPGSSEDWFNLRNGKSVNVNIWIFTQRLNLINHYVNLKYGVGIELYNFRFEEDIRFRKGPARIELDNQINYTKNKLAADYLTVPVMLDFNFTPNKEYNKSFGISAGVSGSYLYASRQKYKSGETGKEKTKGNIGLRDFKLAYVAEVQLGPVKLYGSYATESIYKKGLDHTPYAVGLRLSNW